MLPATRGISGLRLERVENEWNEWSPLILVGTSGTAAGGEGGTSRLVGMIVPALQSTALHGVGTVGMIGGLGVMVPVLQGSGAVGNGGGAERLDGCHRRCRTRR